MKKLTVPIVVVCAAFLMSDEGFGQDVLGDLIRERVDEHRLRHDYRVLHRDMAHGNSAAVQADMMRIQQDQAVLARDQAQLNYDRSGGPNYSGYYRPGAGPGYPYSVPAAPALLQPIPQPGVMQTIPQPPLQPIPQPLAPPVPPSLMPPANPPPSGTGLVPQDAAAGLPQTIRISNPSNTGVTLNYIFGGRTYSLDSGRTEEFAVMSPTTIVFNRGGQAGIARYTLTGGSTFEFKSDTSGWYMVQRQPQLAAVPQDPIPPSPLPNPAPLPDSGTGSLPPLSPIIPQP